MSRPATAMRLRGEIIVNGKSAYHAQIACVHSSHLPMAHSLISFRSMTNAQVDMCTYKGNVGNLMQHWTLCEVLQVANEHASGLSFIDAHAMAPLATTRTAQDAEFDSVRDDLPGQESVYEKAWHRLVLGQCDVYPNSAALVREVWKSDYSLLLCEKNSASADEIDGWLPGTCNLPECKGAKLFRGDWRTRFAGGLPSPCEAGLPKDSLTLVAFDPYMFSRHSPHRQPAGNLYPKDLKLVLRALDGVRGGVFIQLSTYTANDNNPQGSVIASVNSVLWSHGFALAAVVRANENMISLVYAREVDWATDLAGLPGRFEEWRRP